MAREYVAEIEAIKELIPTDRNSKPGWKDDAKSLYKQLKAKLKEDAHRVRVERESAKLSPEEEQFYTVCNEAETRLSAATNTDPVKSNWRDELYSCQIDFDHYLSWADEGK